MQTKPQTGDAIASGGHPSGMQTDPPAGDAIASGEHPSGMQTTPPTGDAIARGEHPSGMRSKSPTGVAIASGGHPSGNGWETPAPGESEGRRPVSLKADKQIYALPAQGRALSVLHFADRQSLNEFLNRRAALVRDAGGCPWLNLPRNPRAEPEQGGWRLTEEMLLARPDGPEDARADDLARALIGLHRAGWVHMDVKPEHLLYASGRWMLHDFDGAMPVGARFSRRDVTFEYAPPDVLWHDRADASDDLYAAALTLYRWRAGRLPLQRGSERRAAALRRLCPAIPVPRDWGDEARRFFRRALAMRRGRRFHSAREWANAWRQVEMMWKAGEEYGEHSQE